MENVFITEDEARRMICPLMSFASDRLCCTCECMGWVWRNPNPKDSGDYWGTCPHLRRSLEMREPPTRFSR